MDEIEHKYMEVNGQKLHVAETGKGSLVVVFLYGFPEIWYSWRHQMVGAAQAGFRAIAPDYRGYGLSDPPPEPEKTTYSDFVSDLLAILDAMSISKIFLVAKDFGVRIASLFVLLHKDRASGIITLGVPFTPRSRPSFTQSLPEGCYVLRWQEPGRAEAEFSCFDAKTVVRKIYILFSKPEIPTAPEGIEIMDLVDQSSPLPSWFTEEDLAMYGSLYEKSGFSTALRVPYRSLYEEFNISNLRIEVPGLMIIGERDYSLKFPGLEDYIRSGRVKASIPNLEMISFPEGTHFFQEQLPET
ncbi:hypothetical protein ACH5RR_017867 [Cinchona calisaya]|uniref:AB hydrolase-1 domain-containing protein n=1 Tax=Cinchona calisaya TaxID=153742 RepID=A0ABD2ZK63_9GENT